MSNSTKPSIVCAHGIWADGSCFSKVIPALQAAGHELMSTQNSLDTLEGDVAAVKRALGRVNSPVILVGHSYGAQVITAAGNDDRVIGLVYIAALGPDDGETSQSRLDRFPTTDVFAHIAVADGRVWMLPDGVQYFAGDLSTKCLSSVKIAICLSRRAGRRSSRTHRRARARLNDRRFRRRRVTRGRLFQVIAARVSPRAWYRSQNVPATREGSMAPSPPVGVPLTVP